MPKEPYKPADVAGYYNDFTDTYLKVTGDFIQAFRPQDTNLLMRSISKSAGIRKGMHILDAGCGVGAPAIWLAKHFRKVTITALTISERQYTLATEKVRAAKLQDRIKVVLGDYHQLITLFPAASFDAVLFLESMGHCSVLRNVIAGAGHVLKPGGTLYIKDFFRRLSANAEQQAAIDEAIQAINEQYYYQTLDLSNLINELQQHSFGQYVLQQPALTADLSVTVRFEEATQRKTYHLFGKVNALDWYELKATAIK